VSKGLEVTTRTKDDAVGASLVFDNHGRLVRQAPLARSVGTTVKITGLFQMQPVRFKQFKVHAKEQFADLVSLMQACVRRCRATELLLRCSGVASSNPSTLPLPPPPAFLFV
jgi:DNA mismatch repair ATPase MutL